MSSRLSPKVLGLVAAGATATAIAVAIIPEHEGTRLSAYQDGARVWTICTGHTGRMSGPPVRPGQRATEAECRDFLASDLGQTFAEMDRLIKIDLPEPTQAAIASFTFNLGAGALRQSTLLKKLNAGDIKAACDEIPRWSKVDGKDCAAQGSTCRGIIERRAQERELCLAGVPK